jgi:hypothetical protein
VDRCIGRKGGGGGGGSTGTGERVSADRFGEARTYRPEIPDLPPLEDPALTIPGRERPCSQP